MMNATAAILMDVMVKLMKQIATRNVMEPRYKCVEVIGGIPYISHTQVNYSVSSNQRII